MDLEPRDSDFIADYVEYEVAEGREMVTLTNRDHFCQCGRPKRTFNDACWVCTAVPVVN